MRLTLEQIGRVVGAKVDSSVEVTGIALDSRMVKPGDLFCAIRGDQVDGHQFVDEAAKSGAVAALVTKSGRYPIPTICIASITSALAEIAAHIRSKFHGPVIGITGSVGKTTVKELLAAALAPAGQVLKSEGNQNTELSLPVTWMRLESTHKFVVLEMAMRGSGQIAHLAAFSKPTGGIITRIGTSHLGELGGADAIAAAKAELLAELPEDGFAVLPEESSYIEMLKRAARCKTVTFGLAAGQCQVLEHTTNFESGFVECTYDVLGAKVHARIPGMGKQQAANGAAALAACHCLSMDLERAADAMSGAVMPMNRLVTKRTAGSILVDVYNSSPESCVEALQVLAEHPAHGDRIAVLGDMLELGDHAESAHRAVGAEAARLGINRLSVIGRLSHWIREGAVDSGFAGRIDSLSDIEQAANILRNLNVGDVALIKGSRALGLEKAVELAGAA
jgi:UDP-N-acetylmuramoyl-tripeptide--D-alanyl-D-alanine ligase